MSFDVQIHLKWINEMARTSQSENSVKKYLTFQMNRIVITLVTLSLKVLIDEREYFFTFN